MMNSRANVRPYNAQVLIGNWFEDRVMEEEVLKDFLDKRYTGQLASQKMTEVERMSQSVGVFSFIETFNILSFLIFFLSLLSYH